MTVMDLTNPLGWAAGSLILGVVAPNLARLATSGRMPGVTREFLARLPLPALAWLVASLYLLLLPFGAWQSGALSPYYLGLAGLDWIDGLAKGGSLLALIVGITIAGWLLYRRGLAAGTRPRRIWTAPVDAALQQWHWAFYRAAVIGWLASGVDGAVRGSLARWLLDLLQAQPLYWGAWLGLGLIVLEWVLNPFTWRGLRKPGWRETAWLSAALAIATTSLFILTRNLWLCLAVHIAVETAICWVFPIPETRQASASQGRG